MADPRVHQTTQVRPADRRAEDVAACTPWVEGHRFWYGEEIVRPVYPDGYVRWDGCTWAVGFAYLGQEVTLRRRPGGGVVIRHGDQVVRAYGPPPTAHAVMGDPGPAPRSPTSPRPAASSRGVHQVVTPAVEERPLAVYEEVLAE